MKFKRVGADYDAIFSRDAVDGMRSTERLLIQQRDKTGRVVKSLSNIYPLTVNRFVIRALNQAAEIGEPRVTAEIVKEL